MKHAARKTVRALSVPDFALYDRHVYCWRLCQSEHTKIRQFGDRWGVEFVEGPCPKSHIGVDLVRPLDAPMISCFEEEKIHAFLQNLWFSRILLDVNRSFLSSHFATSAQNNPSLIHISDSDMASNQSALGRPAHTSSDVEVESARITVVEPVHESERTEIESNASEHSPKAVRKSRKARSESGSAFGLTKNQATEVNLSTLCLKYAIDKIEYRLFLEWEVTSMSTQAIPIPIAHFKAGLRLPLDPSFAEFLIFARPQPAHIHPNVVRLVMCLIVLCRRLGVEPSMNLIRHFFSSLSMINNVLSMRPQNNVVSLFTGLPNKIRWTNKWVMVEAKHGFPFPPLVGHIRKWDALGSEPQWSEDELNFLTRIKDTLGDDPQTQSGQYAMDDLLSKASLQEAGIGASIEKRKALGLDKGGVEEYDVWNLHPGKGFSTECSKCADKNQASCEPVVDESTSLASIMSLCVTLFTWSLIISFFLRVSDMSALKRLAAMAKKDKAVMVQSKAKGSTSSPKP